MNIEILPAKITDAKEIVKIENACFSTPWSLNSVRESLENKNSRFYLAKIDGDTVGYIGVQIFSREGYVTNVAVYEKYRRRGVARALLETALQNEMDFLTLEVRPSNTPAVNLYSSLGFELVGKRPKFYREPEEDAILMTKYFTRDRK